MTSETTPTVVFLPEPFSTGWDVTPDGINSPQQGFIEGEPGDTALIDSLEQECLAGLAAVAKHRAMHEDTGVRVIPTGFTVSALPEDDGQGYLYGTHFDITVAYRGRGRWGVLWSGRCLSSSGQWDHESIPSERSDDWLDSHRFDLATALTLAQGAAPDVTVNGHTVADVMARIAGGAS